MAATRCAADPGRSRSQRVTSATPAALAKTYPGRTLPSFRPAEGSAILAVASHQASIILVAGENAKFEQLRDTSGGFSL